MPILYFSFHNKNMKRHYFLYFFILFMTKVCSYGYNIKNHPCCQEPSENLTLAMIIDAFEIYGHDPTEKLDHLAHYQIEMMKIKRAVDQHVINEHVHVATDHLGRFIHKHIQELKVLLIALDDTIDNMLTMYDNHNAIKTERVASFNAAAGGSVPSEFYISQEYYCGKNVYVFLSEISSDIYNMGKGPSPYCRGRSFHFLGFVHFVSDTKYYLEEDPNIAFEMDNYIHGLECNLGVCIYRFPFKKNLQHTRDVSTLPKAIVKCGTDVYKLPPLSAASCIITSGSFILDFNIQGIRFRHYDYFLTIPSGQTYYTKEPHSPLICDHHVCEWNSTNFYGGPFVIPGEPTNNNSPIPPWIEPTPEPEPDGSTWRPDNGPDNNTWTLDGCWYMFPPNYGSIAGISYLDSLPVHEYRFSCQGNGLNKILLEMNFQNIYLENLAYTRHVGQTAWRGYDGLYWYPQWMGAPPHHPYPQLGEQLPSELQQDFQPVYYPHQQGPLMNSAPGQPVAN